MVALRTGGGPPVADAPGSPAGSPSATPKFGVNSHTLTSPPTNLFLKADGTINNINGFGTVNGARDPRIMHLVIRLKF